MKKKIHPLFNFRTLFCILLFTLVAALLSGPLWPAFKAKSRSFVFFADLEQHLKSTENKIKPKPGTEKTIMWAHQEKKNKTPIALVYLHGFSASRVEVSPSIENVASSIKANSFFTRFKGHGLDGQAMAQVTAQDWLDDAEEAFQIGSLIGEKVWLIGTSTGALSAVYLALHHPEVAGAILISPNFKIFDPRAMILSGPLAPIWAKVFIGKEREYKTKNELQAKFWTYRYPSTALIPMMELIKYIDHQDLSKINSPLLVIYSPNDHIVDVNAIKSRFKDYGSSHKSIVDITAEDNHILAGEIMSPSTTKQVSQLIEQFIIENSNP